MADILVVGLNHGYQFGESLNPTPLEAEQRKCFAARIHELIQDFRPTIIADENPDTTNQDLRSTYPKTAVHIMVDIPAKKKSEHRLWVQRKQCSSSKEVLCPDVDVLRERYWRRQIHDCCGARVENPRVFMLCGANHLYESPDRALDFPQMLRKAGHFVQVVDLLKEPWWNDSWLREWKHPESQPPL